MKSMKRALRRHHRQRMIQRALQFCALIGIDDPSDRLRLARKLADQLKACSCYRCGNPRRYYGDLPRQELRQWVKTTSE